MALAAACALIMPPAAFIERAYSNGLFRYLQPALTTVSNVVPFGLFDLVLVGIAVAVLVGVVRVFRAPRVEALPFFLRLVMIAAGLTVWFFAAWGFNMRRQPLRETLAFDSSGITASAAQALAARAVEELNALVPQLPETWPSDREMDGALAPAFAKAESLLGLPWHSVPARPKTSLLSPYLRATGLNGMAIPFFGEAYLNASLLDFERPYVVAHEWAHVAGRRNEHQAAFIGWLACMHGPAWARYSAWMRLYEYAFSDIPPDARGPVHAKLNRTTRRHFTARFERATRGRVQMAAGLQRGAAAALGRAITQEKSAADYGMVVQLVLGVQLAEVASLRTAPE
ncbi:MAG: hypothetical protein C0503_04655 [Gemmatimonas sp.]|nr:hypothetical protein [Gemmatimonas sp.]